MAADEKTAARGTIATIVATAAVTLAIGVTAAALGGYLVPASDRKETEPAVTETAAGEPRATFEPGAPRVVLVPVAPGSPSEPASTVPGQPMPAVTASDEPTGEHGEDDAHHRKHRRQDGDDEEDHDDD